MLSAIVCYMLVFLKSNLVRKVEHIVTFATNGPLNFRGE